MKKILLSALFSAFVVGISYANDGLTYSENFISELKDKSVYLEDGPREIRKLNRKLDNHFAFIGILRQDLTDALMISLKSDIQPDVSLSEGHMIEKEESSNSTMKKLNPRFVNYSKTK